MSLATLPTLLLVPPMNLLLLACIGALLGQRRAGRWLLGVGLGGMVLLSLPAVDGSLIAVLNRGLAQPQDGPAPQAIVILSGDQEGGQLDGVFVWQVGAFTLEREQAGAALARRTGLPVLVSGGRLHPWSPTLADLMADSLQHDFGVTVRWRETGSLNTWQNARDSAAILRAEGIARVWVVTNAWHMKRALVAFRRAGLQGVAAPVLVESPPNYALVDFVPDIRALLESYYALHEMIGWVWYELRP